MFVGKLKVPALSAVGYALMIAIFQADFHLGRVLPIFLEALSTWGLALFVVAAIARRGSGSGAGVNSGGGLASGLPPINPATGLPMVGLLDAQGNPFGFSNNL